MTIVICELDEGHPYEIGDTVILVKRLQLRDSGGAIWVNRVAMLMDKDEDGNVTPIPVGVGQRGVPGEKPANDPPDGSMNG